MNSAPSVSLVDRFTTAAAWLTASSGTWLVVLLVVGMLLVLVCPSGAQDATSPAQFTPAANGQGAFVGFDLLGMRSYKPREWATVDAWWAKPVQLITVPLDAAAYAVQKEPLQVFCGLLAGELLGAWNLSKDVDSIGHDDEAEKELADLKAALAAAKAEQDRLAAELEKAKQGGDKVTEFNNEGDVFYVDGGDGNTQGK